MLAVHTPKVSQQMLKYISQNAALCLYEQYQMHLSAYSTNSNNNNINKKILYLLQVIVNLKYIYGLLLLGFISFALAKGFMSNDNNIHIKCE